eukprot:scaffold213832_cov34-Prasinocladus_malaysianus.AAC.1
MRIYCSYDNPYPAISGQYSDISTGAVVRHSAVGTGAQPHSAALRTQAPNLDHTCRRRHLIERRVVLQLRRNVGARAGG